MATLPITTPHRTIPIKDFIVHTVDGRTFHVLVDGGEGFFRQQTIKGKEKVISTNECFIAGGRWKILPKFGGEKLSDEPEENNDEPEDEDED